LTTPTSLIPANDAARLHALEGYQLLDARNEKVLNEVVAATAQLFGVSNAMLSIVEKDEVLVKAPYTCLWPSSAFRASKAYARPPFCKTKQRYLRT
jgi:hypothetical protein